MSLTPHSLIFFPRTSDVSKQGQEFLYLATEELSVVKVGPVGAKILEACRTNQRVGDIVESCAKQLAIPYDSFAPSILKFLEKMISAGFLRTSPISQEPAQKYSSSGRFNLIILYLHLTNDCNQSCIYCYNADYRCSVKRSPPLTYYEYEFLLRQAASAGVKQIIFTGGEPLLSPLWQRLAEKVREYNMALVLLTNGALIDENNADLIASLFTKVVVSLDSPDEKIHDQLRGPNTFKKTVQGVRALADRNYGGLVIRPVITKLNLDSLRNFPFFGRDYLGCTKFEVTLYIPNSLQEMEQLDLLPNSGEYQNVMNVFNEAVKTVNGSVQLLYDDTPGVSIRCGAGGNILSIGDNGDVFLCQALHSDAVRLGNIREKDLLEIGNSSPMAVYFRSLNLFSVEKCRECNINIVCGGGCRAVAWNLWGQIEAHEPVLCDFNRNTTWQKLWDFAKK